MSIVTYIYTTIPYSEYEAADDIAGSDSSDEDEDSDSLGADFESLLMNEGKVLM